ncbi:MAG: DUF362 domain-containing protein [Myxococcales bacterium]|nr:DUF362 domain-containing protein [Myxococcales bacterium]
MKKWVGEQNAYTRPEVMEGVLRALKERDGGMTELVVGERCGITIPSRYACEHSGFDAMLERVGGVKRSLSMLKRKLTGKPYQRPGTTERGDGEPEV